MLINHIPMPIKGFVSSEITLTKKEGFDKIKTLMIVHNIPTSGNINSLTAAIDNWLVRTKKYDEKTLIDYINSKGGAFQAYTLQGFKEEFNL